MPNFQKIIFKMKFMKSRDIFISVMLNENTSPGSVLNTISQSESLYCKKHPSFLTSHEFTLFFSILLNLIRYFRTFGQQVLTQILCDKEALTFPYTTLTLEFSQLVWFLRYLHFQVRIRLDPILKKLPSNDNFLFVATIPKTN